MGVKEYEEECEICNGMGNVTMCYKFSKSKMVVTCPICLGIGKIDWITKLKVKSRIEEFHNRLVYFESINAKLILDRKVRDRVKDKIKCM